MNILWLLLFIIMWFIKPKSFYTLFCFIFFIIMICATGIVFISESAKDFTITKSEKENIYVWGNSSDIFSKDKNGCFQKVVCDPKHTKIFEVKGNSYLQWTTKEYRFPKQGWLYYFVWPWQYIDINDRNKLVVKELEIYITKGTMADLQSWK